MTSTPEPLNTRFLRVSESYLAQEPSLDPALQRQLTLAREELGQPGRLVVTPTDGDCVVLKQTREGGNTLYAGVIGTGKTVEAAIGEFMDHLTGFVQARMNGSLDETVEALSTGRAGKPEGTDSPQFGRKGTPRENPFA